MGKELIMGSAYFAGVYFYLSRIPEKYFPGKFDYGVTQKHQKPPTFYFLLLLLIC
jgi:predicted membrane channel-forming protein YqfA (hemolysin III family)